MLALMASKFDFLAKASPKKGGSLKAKGKKGPTFAELGAQARRAVRDGKGVNVTKLSRAEREKLLLEM